MLPQGLALALFLRFRPSFLNGAGDLAITRHILRDTKLAEFIHGREHHIAAEMDRLGVGEWTTIAAAYEVLDNLHYGVSCIPGDFIIMEPMGSSAAARDKAETEGKFQFWTFGKMLDATSSEVTADFVQHLGNYARVEDKTAPTSNYFYLLKQPLKKLPEEDREHWDASPGLSTVRKVYLASWSEAPACCNGA